MFSQKSLRGVQPMQSLRRQESLWRLQPLQSMCSEKSLWCLQPVQPLRGEKDNQLSLHSCVNSRGPEMARGFFMVRDASAG